jgi:hypothetical protein
MSKLTDAAPDEWWDDDLEDDGIMEVGNSVGEDDLRLHVLGGDQWDPDETGAEAPIGDTLVSREFGFFTLGGVRDDLVGGLGPDERLAVAVP